MAIADAIRGRADVLSGRSRFALVGYAALVAIVAGWTWRAFHDPAAFDTRLAYEAGTVAWNTGHPEHLLSWISTPFLGTLFALLSRVTSVRGAADVVTVLNLVMWVGAVVVVLRRTRGLLAPAWWWVAAFGLVSFSPLMSSVWWKQFNPIVLVLALAGFELVRRERASQGAAAIGVSVAIKPMAILLPVVMLARRQTRRAGAEAIGWIVGLNLTAQAFMAWRAGSLSALDPLIGVRNILDKTKPSLAYLFWVNFSPNSLLARAVLGIQHYTIQRFAVWCGLALLGAWVVDALRGRSAVSWEVFAFTCAFSAMLSPLEWTHYQVMLAPLFFLLLFRFAREGASAGTWAGLVLALVLASLIWEPYGTLPGTIRYILTGVRETHNALSAAPGFTLQEGLAQFAQYVLILTGVVWYLAHRGFDARSRQIETAAQT